MRERPNVPYMKDGKRPRCQERICRYIGNWPSYGQCTRSAKVGDRCRQHDPEDIARRDEERQRDDDIRWNKRRRELAATTFYNALGQIATGHNDPRRLAQEVIKTFRDGERT